MIINCIIIDDEPLARKGLKEYIADTDILNLVGEFDNAMKAADIIARGQVQLLFLDIQMPRITGLEFFRTLQNPPPVIFTTAFPQYALDGFEVNALDYLLKPVEPKRLADAIQKLHMQEDRDNHVSTSINVNRSLLTEADQVFVKDGERCWFVKLGEIRLFESVGNYAKVYFGPNKPLILKSLNALEERLDEKTFFRANRKHIVNLRMVEKVEPYFNGGLLLELKGGEKIEVSRRQTVKFKEMMSL